MKRDIFHTFYFQLAQVILALVTSVFSARLLGPEGKSDMAVFLLSVGILSQILMFGVAPSVTHYLAKGAISVRWFTRLMVAQVALSVAVCILIFVLIRSPDVLAFVVPQPQSRFFHVALPASVTATILATFSAAFLRADLMFRVINLSTFFQALAVLVFTVAFYIVEPDRETAVQLSVALFAGATLFSSLYQFAVFFESYRQKDGTSTPAEARTVFGYARRTFVADLAQMLAYRSDIWFVLYFLTPHDLGQYVLAVNLGQMLWILPNVIGSVLMPNISRDLYSAGDAARLGRLVVAFLTIVGIVVAILGLWLVPLLYGGEFSNASFILVLLMPGMIAISAAKIYANFLAGRGQVGINQRASLITLALSIVGDLILIPLLGLPGAPIATSLSYVVTLAVVLVGISGHTGLPIRDFLIPRREDLMTLKGVPT